MVSVLLIAAFAAAILIAAAFVFAPRAEIVTEVKIDATLAQVWLLLGRPDTYHDWNPFIVSMEGELTRGAVLTNTIRTDAGRETTFRPTVLVAEPTRELRWLGRLFLPRIFDGEHYFLLEEHDDGTRLIHGERFQGVLLWFIDVGQFRANFERMNTALKARVENGAAEA